MDYYGVAIKNRLMKLMGPRAAQEWLRTPLNDFGGLSPQDAMDEGQEEKVLEKIDLLYREKDRNFGTGDP